MIKATYTYTVLHTEEYSFADSVTAVAIAQDAEVRRGRVAADLGWNTDQVHLVNIEFTHIDLPSGYGQPDSEFGEPDLLFCLACGTQMVNSTRDGDKPHVHRVVFDWDTAHLVQLKVEEQ